jgi:DNA adenine methylase
MKPLQPVIKWSGSKRVVAEQLAEFFQPARTYYEPFVGGGSMMPFSKSNKGKASDIIPELISLWNEIKDNPEKVSVAYAERWKRLQTDGYQVYYEIRDSFNATRDPMDFLFLTRTCLNGMIRYNSAGEFNNSFHLTRPGIAPDRLTQIIRQWHQYIRKFDFLNTDYRECLAEPQQSCSVSSHTQQCCLHESLCAVRSYIKQKSPQKRGRGRIQVAYPGIAQPTRDNNHSVHAHSLLAQTPLLS